MLARQAAEWRQYDSPEEIEKPRQKPAPKLNCLLRRRCLTVAAIITLFAAVMTARSDTLNQAGFDLVGMKETENALVRNNEGLQLEVARLQSLERIKTVATQQLGMQQPTAQWYVRAADGQTARMGASNAAVALNKQ